MSWLDDFRFGPMSRIVFGVGKAKEATSDLSSKAEPVLDKARATAGDLVQKAQPVVDKAVEAGGGLVEKAKDLLSSRKDGADDGATEG